MSQGQGRFLFISDLQIPFEHKKALEFCRHIKRQYKIPDENVYCVGDELDEFWGSMFDKDGEFEHTPNQEIDESITRLRDWYIAFPKMKIAESNHGIRWKKKAMHAQIPLQMIKSYKEVFHMPPDWLFKKRWDIEAKLPIIMVHGDSWGGQFPHKNAAIHLARNVVMGHHHSLAGIEHVKTDGYDIWGMVSGCLIDFERYAFNYGRDHKMKPQVGASIVLDDGKTPVWLKLE